MKEFEYELQKEVLGNPNPYSGKVKIKLPKYLERNKLLREINFKSSKEGEVGLSDNIGSLDKLYDVCNEYVLKLDVRKGKKPFHKLDELEYDEDFSSFVTEVGMTIVRGVNLGNA